MSSQPPVAARGRGGSLGPGLLARACLSARDRSRSSASTVVAHLGAPYNQSRMSYDLRRPRLHGLIQRLPHSNTYLLTPEGIRVAAFYTKLQNRLLRPLLEADKPPAPIKVRRALTTLDRAVNDYVLDARLAPAT